MSNPASVETRERQALYINGEWTNARSGGTWDVINPATEEVVATVPFGGRAEADEAIQAAHQAFNPWATLTPYERAAILMKAGAIIRDRVVELGKVNTSESGKPVGQAEGDWLAAAALFEWFAEEGKRAYGRTIPTRKGDKRAIVLKQPLGVVGVITAWNFPAYNPSRAMAAALAAGNTVVLKPSEYTPLTAMLMVGILAEAGCPAGVVNLVLGDAEQIGDAMLKAPECRKIAFTGSVRVGKLLMDGASKTVTRLSLELGGNAPVIIFPDADIADIAANAADVKCKNTGQVCVSPQRFIVHEKARDQFMEIVIPRMQGMRMGNGAEEGTDIGPLINAHQRDHVEELVKAASSNESGGEILTGGKRPANLDRGYFYEPTVVGNVGSDSSLFQNEIFGPVMPVTPFSDVDEVIDLANQTEYGLAAYLFTNDIKTVWRCAERLEFGMVGVNEWTPQGLETPFPGWKQSGIGAECGAEGLDEYLEPKLIGFGGI